MTKTKGTVTVMEMRNVSYVERPKAIHQFLRNGFSVENICVVRVDASHYDMSAKRIEKEV